MSNDVLVVAEHDGATLSDATRELIGAARGIADGWGGQVVAALVGNAALAGALGGADVVVTADAPQLSEYTSEAHERVLADQIRQRQPRLVLISMTTQGLDLAAALSAACECPLVSYVVGLNVEGDALVATAQIYGGKIMAEVEIDAPTAICGVIAGSFPPHAGDAPANVEAVDTSGLDSLRTTFVARHAPDAGDVDITAADLLVAVGRGIGSEDDIELVQEFADALGAPVAASRPVTDAGWLPKSRQVGKSGLKVKPRGYLMFGISGAPEHLEGMRDAELIIACNTDEQAPVFDVAHYGTTADLFDLLPELTERGVGMILTILAVEGETREVFEDLNLFAKVVFYVLSFAATALFLYGWWKRVAKYRTGRPAGRIRPPAPAAPAPSGNGADPPPASARPSRWNALWSIASNSTVAKRDRSMGVAHFFMFWGFITLFIGTVILTIDEDIVRIATRQFGEERSFFKGVFYAVYSFTLDTMGAAALLALVYMAARRGLFHLPQLNYRRAQEPAGGYDRRQYERGDQLFIGLLGLVLLTGFLHEGFRIRASDFPDFEIWSPVGWLIATAVSGVGIPQAGADTVRTVIWWVHALLALGFVAYIPYSKAMHMLTDPANLMTYDPTSSRRLPAPVAAADHVGYVTLEDFTWKELLDLDACTKCGRCHVVCPAAASGAPLSPRDLILDLRQWSSTNGGTATLLDSERRPEPSGPLEADGALAGGVILADTLWACTTCMACVEACPVGIEHVPTIVQLRRTLVEAGTMEPSLQSALQNIAQKGNSFGKSARQRAKWTKELDFTIKDVRTEPVRYLWFVGDFASFDDRLQALSRTFAQILHGAGVDFGILYDGERNAGNDVRRVGEEGLFELLVEQNMEQLAAADFDEIVTTDPHTLNTLRNEYPAYGLTKPVKHYTEVLADLLDTRDLAVAPLHRSATYHDPCYLARYNDLTEAPRRVLRAIGCDVVEMPRNKDNTFCCGAGGGRIWMDDSDLTERPSEGRIKEAAALDVEMFVVACPKDFTMYTDAAKTTGHDQQMRVVDVIELVAEALDRQPALGVADS